MVGKTKNPSIWDVAEKAGVSIAAVSRVLNKKHKQVSSKTLEKVLKASGELGYRINPSIQDFVRKGRNGHTRNLVFVMVGGKFSAHGYSQATDGFANAGTELNYNLSLARLSGNETSTHDFPAMLRDGRCDGIIVTGDLDEKSIALIKELDKPYVVLGVYSDRLIGSSYNICLNVGYAAFRIVEELKRAEKTRIAYFTGDPQNHFARELFHAFQKAMHENSLQFDQGMVFEGRGSDMAGNMELLARIFEKDILPFDSIICEYYECALAITHFLGARRNVCGKERIILATSRPPGNYKLPVPTIYIDSGVEKAAYEGVKVLVQAIEGRTETAALKIEVKTEPVFEDAW
jgi:LacI family repressor for deo operon, udp, cdd, tsx, nupC, and nupG